MSPSAKVEEVEARYRLLIREYHPDLHQNEGPDSLAHCLAMTQNLNAAMTCIREQTIGDRQRGAPPSTSRGATTDSNRTSRQWAGENPFYRPPEDPSRDRYGNASRGGVGSPGRSARDPGPREPVSDWFESPTDHPVGEPVPCPFCNVGFQRLVDYELHLQQDHNFRFVAPTPKGPPSRFSLVNLIGWMRFIPIWFAAIITFGVWKAFGTTTSPARSACCVSSCGHRPAPDSNAADETYLVSRRQPPRGPPPAPTTATSGSPPRRVWTCRASPIPHSCTHASWRNP